MSNSLKIQKLILALLDVLVYNLGFVLAYNLRYDVVQQFNLDPYLALIPWLSGAVFITFYMFDLYSNWRRKSIFHLIYTIVLAVLALSFLTMAFTFWYRGFAFPRSIIAIAALIQVVLLSVYRSLVWSLAMRVFGRKKVLLIGESQRDCESLAAKLQEHTAGWFMVDGHLQAKELDALEVRANKVDVVFLSPNVAEKGEVINRCAELGKEILVVPQVFELYILGSEPQQVDDMLVLSILPPKLTGAQMLLKRLFDVIICLPTLVLLSPVLVLVYILIPLTSKGTALFKQERLGKEGKPYQVLKFRSMVHDAEMLTGPVFATEKDPRVTSVGRFLRATRLDELPQFINVLKGDMSLVGPRPERAVFIRKFKDEIPHYSHRLSVKPGITGLAQVMAKYSTSAEDKLRFDLMYVRNYSFALDIKILLQTLRVVLQREQSVGVKPGVKPVDGDRKPKSCRQRDSKAVGYKG